MAMYLPRYVLKDCTIQSARTGNRIGQCSEITMPTLEKTTEEFRNAGMLKPHEITMGWEATRIAFKDTAFDPDLFLLLNGNGPAERLIARGYTESEDGSEHPARLEMIADFTKIDPGTWATAQKAENELEALVHSGTLFIDDREIVRWNDFDFWVGGVLQQPGRRAALGLT